MLKSFVLSSIILTICQTKFYLLKTSNKKTTNVSAKSVNQFSKGMDTSKYITTQTNKYDKEGVTNKERVKKRLMENSIKVDGWGRHLSDFPLIFFFI